MVKAAGAGELQRRGRDYCECSATAEEDLSTTYNYLTGRCREDRDRLFLDLHHRRAKYFLL